MTQGDPAPTFSTGDVGTELWFENDRVRVWQLKLEPGQAAGFHTHREDYFWAVLDGGKGLARDPDGSTREYEFKEGQVGWTELSWPVSWTHDHVNVGNNTVRMIVVEIKKQGELPQPGAYVAHGTSGNRSGRQGAPETPHAAG